MDTIQQNTNTNTTPAVIQLKAERMRRSRSLWEDAFLYLLRDRLTIISLSILLVMTVVCFFGPPVVQNLLQVDPNRTSVRDRYEPPGENFILGADQLGRDQLIRLLYGGQISLLVAYTASLITITIGVLLGLMSGYYGGWLDDLITWMVNTMNAIPGIFLLLVIASIFKPSPEALVLVLGMLGWVDTCRLVRGEVLTLKQQEYVVAAQALGAPAREVIVRHVLPNVISLVIIAMTLSAGSLILVESALSYLGIGVQPPTPTWGNMLAESRTFFVKGTHLVIWPGAMITLTVLCFYLVGDGLRDALDPRISRRGRK